MEKSISLRSLFEEQRNEIAQKLGSLNLPKDLRKVKIVITEFYDQLFEANGQYRQSLTQSEEYVFQSAIELLNAQQELLGVFANVTPKNISDINIVKNKGEIDRKPILGGAAVGSAVGGVVFNTWGAVLGAVAGTAIALYALSSINDVPESKTKNNDCKAFDIDIFLDVMENICERMDILVNTVRTQIVRITESYEKIEKPTLFNTYPSLVTGLESLFQAYESNDDDKQEQIELNINMLLRALKNYGLTFDNGKLK